MNENPSIEIEIGGHTDHVGSEQDNVLLSQARADKIREYLSQKGISTGRMLAKGYGESKPLVPNDTETNRQLNRRVEFLILKK
jgi:outer membrane protein OmpA-like peptidoglycan-associated protein